MNPARQSGDAWVLFASSLRSRKIAQSYFNALPAETARWKRTVPRFAPINVLIATDFYLHSLQLTEAYANKSSLKIMKCSEDGETCYIRRPRRRM
jgi:hypothetical protein